MEEELYKDPSTYLFLEQAKILTYSLMIDFCLFSVALIPFLFTNLASVKVCYHWHQWNFISRKADKSVVLLTEEAVSERKKHAFAVTKMKEMKLILVYLQLYSFEALQNPMKI